MNGLNDHLTNEQISAKIQTDCDTTGKELEFLNTLSEKRYNIYWRYQSRKFSEAIDKLDERSIKNVNGSAHFHYDPDL